MAQDKRLLIIVNEDRFFLSHRKDIGINALKSGWHVSVVCKDTGKRRDIEQLGLNFIELPVNPTGKGIANELRTLRFLYKLYGKERSAIVHQVGIKSIVWGGIASRLRKTDGVINAVSGLGIMFSDYNPSNLKKVLIPLIRWGMHHRNVSVIFQNHDDERLFNDLGISSNTRNYFIKGSGVDLSKYPGDAHSDDNKIRIIFAGRMVKDKGVGDLIKAAEILRSKYEDKVEFILCGSLSNNPFGLREEELKKLCDGKYIKWLGFVENMHEWFNRSDIMCFPSYYREGVPKAILDASGAGLPVITCDSIGCRDTVIDGLNGFKIPPQAPEKIAEKIEILVEDETLRRKMGRESRKIAERDYNVNKVIDAHLKIYEDALKNKKNK